MNKRINGKIRKWLILPALATIFLSFVLSGCSVPEIEDSPSLGIVLDEGLPQEGEFYYDVENVVLYLDLYHELPLNYITKEEAEKRGWQGGSVEAYVEDAAIGGDYFGNYEGLLPEDDYKECDIDTHNYKNRGSRRLIYTDDGKYFYTKDHYESFSEVTVDDNYNVTIH